MTTATIQIDNAVKVNVLTETRQTAIQTRYYGPSNTRGARIRAWRADAGTSPTSDRYAVTVPYDYGSANPHLDAIEAYIARHGEAGHDWTGEWVVGAISGGYVAVFVPGSST